jgi:hypothetical protein
VKLILNGTKYEDVGAVLAAANRVPVLHWIELEEQGHINPDDVDRRALPWRTLVVCWEFLLRRAAGEDVTFRQVAAEVVIDDVVLEDPEDGEQAAEQAQAEAPDPPAAGGEPSPT